MEEEKQIEMMKTLQIAVNSSDNFVEDLLIESIQFPAENILLIFR